MKKVRGKRQRVCANCGGAYDEGDSYCRRCGAPLGEEDYISELFPIIYGPPSLDDEDYISETFAIIYGPPPMNEDYVCEKCGYRWKRSKPARCPRCGERVDTTKGLY